MYIIPRTLQNWRPVWLFPRRYHVKEAQKMSKIKKKCISLLILKISMVSEYVCQGKSLYNLLSFLANSQRPELVHNPSRETWKHSSSGISELLWISDCHVSLIVPILNGMVTATVVSVLQLYFVRVYKGNKVRQFVF